MNQIFMERLRSCRKEMGKTQETAAREMGILTRSYCGYERGETEPSMSSLMKLADYYNVSIDYLVGRTDQR